jgi:hypothetical protein
MEGTIYGEGLDRNPANYQPLTPLKHLSARRRIFPDHVAIIHGIAARTYGDFYARSRKLASALQKARIRGFHRRRRPGVRLADAGATNGTRSRSTTPRARPAIRRASSTTIAARR